MAFENENSTFFSLLLLVGALCVVDGTLCDDDGVTCYCDLEVESITIGSSEVPVCLAIKGDVITDSYSATDTKTHFFPVVDDFTDLQIAGSFEFYVNEPVTIQVEIAGAVSPPVTYKKNGLVVPMFTAVAVVDNGVVKAILWDNGCFDCEGKGYKCIGEDNASFCAVPEKNCSDDFNCEIQVFLGWKGTDDGDAFLTSEGQRFSRFRKYSVSGFYSDIASDAAAAVSDVKDLGGKLAEVIQEGVIDPTRDFVEGN